MEAASKRSRSADAETESVRDAFVQLWARMAPFWGTSPATARVYAWLLSKKAGADAETLTSDLSMSRGAVSMACAELADWGLVRIERTAGERRATYVADPDLERAIRNIIQTRKRREWDPILEHLREWIPRLESARSDEAAAFRERLESVEALVSMADSMAEMFLKGGMVRQLGLKVLVAAAQLGRRGSRRRSRR